MVDQYLLYCMVVVAEVRGNSGGVAVAVAVAEASGGKMRNELGSGALV